MNSSGKSIFAELSQLVSQLYHTESFDRVRQNEAEKDGVVQSQDAEGRFHGGTYHQGIKRVQVSLLPQGEKEN